MGSKDNFSARSCYDRVMPLQPDDTVCYCFHVPLRKIQAFCRIEKPRRASQISECLSAGTGCGWCVPLLKKIHREMCPAALPPWQEQTPDSSQPSGANCDDAASYAAAREAYIARKKDPPAGT